MGPRSVDDETTPRLFLKTPIANSVRVTATMDPRIIIKKLQILEGLCAEKSLPIGPWQARTARHIAPEQYEQLDDWEEIPARSHWLAGLTVFMRGRVHVPDDWDLANTFLQFGFDTMEGLLTVNGRPWSGLDHGRSRCPAPARGDLDLEIEWDCVPRVRCEPHLAGTTSTFTGARLVQINPEVEAALWDMRFAFEAFNALEDGRRKELLGKALEESMLAFTLSAPREVMLEELDRARKHLLAGILNIGQDPENGRIMLTGHTHIDVAYLWPIKETIRKCGRTFSTACWMMDRYPDYKFSCSQAQVYQFARDHYPDVYARMRELIASGRWETTGGMWVEADCNVTSGESLIRQILHGLAFFREEFGTRPTVCWLPDVFGYNAGLPQILAGCGLTSFWTWKLHWQSRNPFPHHLFWWQGCDGTRVLAHIPKLGGGGYNGQPTPEQLATAWRTYLQKGTYDQQLFPFGFGDGGGGVNEQMMEYARRAERFPGLPECRIGTSEEFFAQVREDNPDLPTWVGELYLETHRGTFTSQARTKRANRRCELALRSAEMIGVVANRLHERVDMAPLRSAWEKVLLHQFHDILPGTSVTETFEDAARDHEQVLETARRVGEQALSRIVGDARDTLRYAVFNALSWERSGVVELDAPDVGDDLVGVIRGQQVPVQVIGRDGDRIRVLAAAERVPSLGGALLELVQDRPLRSLVTASENTLENQYFRVQLSGIGEVLSIYDKRAGREVIPEGQPANRLQLFQDGPEREAAWNVHTTSTTREYPWDGDCSLRVTENGPVRATIRVERSHRDTRLIQDIMLYDNKPRIDFRTWVDWRERQTMLKAAFPLAIHAEQATYEVQFGAIQRPTHRNTSWDEEKFEVAAQRWADLSEGGYGVSLLNDCKYGHDALGNVLRLTLLRGPEYPDPEADLGEHEFTYSLLPHEGDWRQGGTVQQAWQLNVPLFAVPTDRQQSSVCFMRVDGPAIVETVKPAEDGRGDILRLYEPYGSRGRVTVEINFPVSEVRECNLVEEDGTAADFAEGVLEFDIRPFEIKTFRLV